MTVGESVTVNGEDGGACYQVTLSEDNEGNLEYYFEKIGSGRGCKDISHMVGYYADPILEEPEGYCGDGIVQRGEECEPGNGPCNDECVIPTLNLQLNLVCLGVGQFAWSVTNPNNFEVQNVQVLIDGSLVFDGSLTANATVGLGMTGDGPATHTMVVTWEEEGSAFLESNMVCLNTFTPPPQDQPIPVTGLQFLIPVTGLDLTSGALALRAAVAAGGFSILAFSYAMSKRKRED
jgi:hypothetical protein